MVLTSYTLAELQQLQRAMARGVKSVTYNGETVVYRSLDEMRQAERIMKRDLGLIGSTSRRRFGAVDKGL